ncbi:hypothetical protein K9L63_01445 [Candidatus Gracilibacteria bacterium]|nr:hypothetical protein [Candidatus Gracilibacteria bacterium]
MRIRPERLGLDPAKLDPLTGDFILPSTPETEAERARKEALNRIKKVDPTIAAAVRGKQNGNGENIEQSSL